MNKEYKTAEELMKDLNKFDFWWEVRYYLWWKWVNLFRDTKDNIKWGFQRMFRGYDDEVYWSLYSALRRLIIPGLKHLREHEIGHPMYDEIRSWDDWAKVLDEMIEGFKIFDEEDDRFYEKGYFDSEQYKIDEAKKKRALELFAKYYRSLWC